MTEATEHTCTGYFCFQPNTSLRKSTWSVVKSERRVVVKALLFSYTLKTDVNQPLHISRDRQNNQFSSVAQLCPTLCNPMDCSTSGFHVHHQLPELVQTHVRWISDAIQPSHSLSPPSPPAFHHSQHQGLFQRLGFSHQWAKALELQL